MAQLVKNPPAMRDTWVQSLGWEDPLEKGNVPTPVFWPGEFHVLYSPWGHKESDTTKRLSLSYMKLRCLLLGREATTNLDRILKSRDITLPTKVHLVKAMLFSIVMYGCESWTINKAEHLRTDVFELRCWRLLRVPWTARRFNQSILKEISLEYSLEDAEAEAPILWPPDMKN